MSKLFECELEYFPNPHLMQIYTGFFELQKLGIVDLKIKRIKHNSSSIPIINAVIDNKFKVVYDTIDGLTWVPGDDTVNLEHFQKAYKADFYFKRSYDPRMQQYKPENCEVYPLGLNYNMHPDKNMLTYQQTLKDKIKYLAKTNKFFKTNKPFFYASDFEYYPIKPKNHRILFLTRLWSPEEAKSERSRKFRTHINATRIKCIELCKKEFGDRFTGGLQMESYAKANFPALAMPTTLTNKAGYLQTVKEHSICIATTGLHNSIGWKLAEYVAASRAIITEPLKFSLPGHFSKDCNYLEFETPEQLLIQTGVLLSNPDRVMDMMRDNYYYYNNFVKPERLILNTLLTVSNKN